MTNRLNDTDAAFVAIAFSLCLNMFYDTDAACVAVALALCLNMLNDTHAVFCDHCFSPAFQKEK
jgi:hypothetical protein